MRYWVSIVSPSKTTCNALMISCSSLVTTSGSNPNVFLNSKNFFDDFLELLIFLSTKSFGTNTLHRWCSALGVNSCLYFCFSRWHLLKICAQLATSDSTSKFSLFAQKYLPLSIISISHFYILLCWFEPFYTCTHTQKTFFDGLKCSIIFECFSFNFCFKSLILYYLIL